MRGARLISGSLKKRRRTCFHKTAFIKEKEENNGDNQKDIFEKHAGSGRPLMHSDTADRSFSCEDESPCERVPVFRLQDQD